LLLFKLKLHLFNLQTASNFQQSVYDASHPWYFLQLLLDITAGPPLEKLELIIYLLQLCRCIHNFIVKERLENVL
jgi:hypothetical protein